MICRHISAAGMGFSGISKNSSGSGDGGGMTSIMSLTTLAGDVRGMRTNGLASKTPSLSRRAMCPADCVELAYMIYSGSERDRIVIECRAAHWRPFLPLGLAILIAAVQERQRPAKRAYDKINDRVLLPVLFVFAGLELARDSDLAALLEILFRHLGNALVLYGDVKP